MTTSTSDTEYRITLSDGHVRLWTPFLFYVSTRLLGLLLRGTVASGSVRSSPDGVVLVQALAGNIVLCSWVKHFTLTVPLSTQVYK